MAIAFDASTDGGLVNPNSSLTFSHTCSGADRCLFVGVRSRLSTIDQVTGVTYNGVAMTPVVQIAGDTTSKRCVSLWMLVNPDSGSNSVSVSGSASDVIIALAASYTGVLSTGQPDATGSNTTVGTSISTSVTTVADNCWMVSVVGNNVGTLTGSPGQTLRQNSSNGIAMGDSNAAITPAQSYNMQATIGSSTDLAIAMASVAPLTSGGAVIPVFMNQYRQRRN
jgi:hypothetical protein